MPTVTVDTDVLYSQAVEAYVTESDARVRVGFRAALETLGLPLPPYAVRQPTGPKPGQRLRAAFNSQEPAPQFLSIPAKTALCG